MGKIKKVSYFFRIFFQLCFMIVPLLLIYFWINAPKLVGFPQIGATISFIPSACNVFPLIEPLPLQTKILGFLISLIPIGILELTLYFLIKLFYSFEQGEIFSLKNVNNIKRAGYTLLIGQLINPIYEALMTVTLSWYNKPKYISITITGINIGIILTALMIILISWIMAEGYRLQEEQGLTI